MDSSLLPLYLVVANELEARITADQYPPGTLLPAERKLAIGFDVSQITIRAAMRILSDKGLIVRRRGIGTTVVEAHPRFVWQLGWLDALITTIIPSSLSIQSMQTARPPRWVAERFGSAAKVHRMTTLRQRGGQEARPFMTSELFHPDAALRFRAEAHDQQSIRHHSLREEMPDYRNERAPNHDCGARRQSQCTPFRGTPR